MVRKDSSPIAAALNTPPHKKTLDLCQHKKEPPPPSLPPAYTRTHTQTPAYDLDQQ